MSPSRSDAPPPQKRSTVSLTRAAAVSDRLVRWKQRSEAKCAVKAKLQQDARLEEEQLWLATTRVLPERRVHAAVTRNFDVASERQWKKWQLQASEEQRRQEEEAVECTFRPRLVAKRPVGTTPTGTQRVAASTTVPSAKGSSRTRGRRRTAAEDEATAAVFDRLSRPRQLQPPDVVSTRTAPSCGSAKRLSPRQVAAFVARQELHRLEQQRKREQLLLQQRSSHVPSLSRRTHELCAALREKNLEELLLHERHKRLQRLAKCQSGDRHFDVAKVQRRNTKTAVTPSSARQAVDAAPLATMPFPELIAALQQQERRMRSLPTCA